MRRLLVEIVLMIDIEAERIFAIFSSLQNIPGVQVNSAVSASGELFHEMVDWRFVFLQR